MATLCNSCESQDTCKIFEIMGDGMPITHCKNYIQTRRETVRVKQTNADRIRSMSDEELAEFMQNEWLDIAICNELNSAEKWLAWLRKESNDTQH